MLIDLESRHGRDAGSLSSGFVGVNIDFFQHKLRVVCSMLLENRSDHFAGWASGSSKVNDERLTTIGSSCNSCIEVGLVAKVHFSMRNMDAFDFFQILVYHVSDTEVILE